jgi:hypothetical protein
MRCRMFFCFFTNVILLWEVSYLNGGVDTSRFRGGSLIFISFLPRQFGIICF